MKTNRIWYGFLLLILAPAILVAADWPSGISADLRFETSDFLKSTAYRNPDRVDGDVSPSGAYSSVNQSWDTTHRGRWYIEQQRYGFDAVVAGLAYGRQDLIDRGKKILDWGFRQEQRDGSFDCPDRFHSASFFIEAAAHAALLIQASPFYDRNRNWVQSVKPKLLAAARWMINPRNEGPGRKRDFPYTHRFYLDAAALGETGTLTGDTALIERSKSYIREGLARQDPSGFNPEKDGYDTSYHAVGLLFALNYYTLVADEDLRIPLGEMIEKGLRWLKERVHPDGTVDQTGNTRTGFSQEIGRNGKLKTMNYGSAYRAAYYWGLIQNDPVWTGLAQKLYEGDRLEKRRGHD